MFHNAAIYEMTSKHIMADRLREAEQYRLLRSAEARRSEAKGLLGVIRRLPAMRRVLVRPTTAAG